MPSRRAPLLPLLLLAASALSCGGDHASSRRAVARPAGGTIATTGQLPSTAPPPRDDGRLPLTATPLRYALALTIDPTQTRFAGNERVLVDIPQPTSFIVMHARDIDVRDVVATQGARRVTATATHRAGIGTHHEEELVLSFAEPLAPGQATIAIAYDAPFASDLAGVFRVKDGERWYAFTQFEANDARRAFPCFDEPAWKTAYDVSITAPKGMIAVANAPEIAHDDAGAMTTFRFATTRPLSSYLVAFAVGDFDVRGYAGASNVPIRLIAAKGRGALGDAALDAAAAILKRIGDYFDVGYPYEKLDLVAVPDFAAGAMENPGLVTFVEDALLLDPKTASLDEKRDQAMVIAHELSHQWFGNLVTMQWWDDLWLNEGFASWMEAKIVQDYNPELGARLFATRAAQRVMDIDALKSAHAVRGPVRTTEDTNEIFDDITYAKAGALLAMIERWVGEATFQKALRDYVRAYAWKTAKAEDLLRALDLASNKDVTKVATSFLDRAGVPSMRVSFACKDKRASVEIKQSPWRPIGSEDGGDARWNVPVCMRTPGAKEPACVLSMGDATGADLAACPAWLYPNAHQAGYFRFSLEASALSALAKSKALLDPAERVGLVGDAWGEVRTGDLPPAALLDVLPAFDDEADPYVTDAVIEELWGIRDALVAEPSAAAFRAYVANRFRARARSLGWEARRRGKDDEALLREKVQLAMGELAEDDATLRQADALAQKWLKDEASVDADMAELAVELGSRRANEARFEALRAAAKSAKNPEARSIALHGLGGFGDAGLLRRALDLILTDEVRVHEAWYVMSAASAHAASRPVLWAWTKANWDALRAKVPPPLAWMLVRGTSGVCTEPALADARSFLGAHAHEVEGLRRPADAALEEAALCVALRERASAAAVAYFTKK